jgi:hypothetical protein
MIYLLPIILFIFPLAYKVKDNFEKWKIDIPVNHSKQWKWVALVEGLTSGLGFIILSDKPLWYSIPVSLFRIAFWFWFLFDGWYNLIRKKYAKESGWRLTNGQYDFWYTGSDDRDDAVSDNILQRLTLWQHIALKVGLIILFTYLYVK